jgi:hypothetical protein
LASGARKAVRSGDSGKAEATSRPAAAVGPGVADAVAAGDAGGARDEHPTVDSLVGVLR